MTNHNAVERLRAAVLEVVTENPYEEPTVASICAAAALSRSEFHQHASSPMQLLSEALADDLLTEIESLSPSGDKEVRTRLALEHIKRWFEVYRGPFRQELMAMLRQTLAPALQSMNEREIHDRAASLPAGIDVDDESEVAFIAAYIAGGSMAAIERWIECPEPDVDSGIKLLRAASPSFWVW
ncbi:MAG: hypothetical protein OJJ55_26075 [Rhodococcus sp.]|nr:hypothetical protein [Rhodococcus sp. (in: high G+C Gram-positive bacteria)]